MGRVRNGDRWVQDHEGAAAGAAVPTGMTPGNGRNWGGIVRRRRLRIIVLAATFALTVVVPVLGGCGSRKAPDLFVGTWHQVDSGKSWAVPLVIAKVQGGYLVTLPFPEAQPQFQLVRHGNELVGTAKLGMGPARVEVTYLPKSGHLTLRNARSPGGPMSGPVEFVRISGSTAIPTRSP